MESKELKECIELIFDNELQRELLKQLIVDYNDFFIHTRQEYINEDNILQNKIREFKNKISKIEGRINSINSTNYSGYKPDALLTTIIKTIVFFSIWLFLGVILWITLEDIIIHLFKNVQHLNSDSKIIVILFLTTLLMIIPILIKSHFKNKNIAKAVNADKQILKKECDTLIEEQTRLLNELNNQKLVHNRTINALSKIVDEEVVNINLKIKDISEHLNKLYCICTYIPEQFRNNFEAITSIKQGFDTLGYDISDSDKKIILFHTEKELKLLDIHRRADTLKENMDKFEIDLANQISDLLHEYNAEIRRVKREISNHQHDFYEQYKEIEFKYDNDTTLLWLATDEWVNNNR